MFIKIDEKTYINTDKIMLVVFDDLLSARIYWQNGQMEYSTIGYEAAQHVLLMLEADESMLTAGELQAMPPPSDRTRIAQALRDIWLAGATQKQLEASMNAQDTAFSTPLAELIAEEIVIGIVPDTGDPLYFHANHAPYLKAPCFKPTRDL